MDGQRVAHGVAGAPNESRLLELMERTGYPMIQENGQRKFGGPPPGWQGNLSLLNEFKLLARSHQACKVE